MGEIKEDAAVAGDVTAPAAGLDADSIVAGLEDGKRQSDSLNILIQTHG